MISIVMPTYNRFDIVQETIQKVLDVVTTVEFELIVVNDGAELPFAIHHPKLRIFKNPHKGVTYARNFGASQAVYSLLFFIDDDMWITENAILGIKEAYDRGVLNKSCLMMNWRYPDVLISEMSENKIGRYLLNDNYHTLEGRFKQQVNMSASFFKINAIGSCSFAIHKKLFWQIGGYNEDFIFEGEDIDMSNKLNKANIDILLYTKITCFHNHKDRLDIDVFLDRKYRGYYSQFKQKGDVKNIQPDRIKQLIFTLLMPFRLLFFFLFNRIPNKKRFDVFTFRIIGILSSLSYFKAMYNAGKE